MDATWSMESAWLSRMAMTSFQLVAEAGRVDETESMDEMDMGRGNL
jgi:hypothetical protein